LTGYAMEATDLYKDRFENLFRVARKVTSSLNIGDILEFIRDEAKVTIPYAAEACLLVFDPDAARYTRPLHCGVYKDRLNCQLCKRGRDTIQKAILRHSTLQCALSGDQRKCHDCEIGREMAKTSEAGDNGLSLADSSGSPPGPIGRPCDIALPIYDDDKPLAVLELIAREGHSFTEKDVVLLKDLTQLATNAIVNARRHWRMAQEKLNMDQILAHLRPFVPETVQRIVEKDPSAPFMGKQDVDVSVLFLDVAGYTRISESLTREKLNFIIEKYFSSFLDVIYNFEGDINETAGDGLMVIFQGNREKNGLDAARAALAIRKRTLEINQELEGRFEPVHVNMGINSGLASVGMTKFSGAAGTRMTFTATGPVTNLAARIAAAATEGDILAGPETASRIQNEILLYDRGPMDFKNVKEKVRVFSLIRPA
jgi:class 3 adenylate cyclase